MRNAFLTLYRVCDPCRPICRYLGRKKLNYQTEVWVPEAEMLVWAHYSYWTLGYLLHRDGAKKLLDQKPLQKMLPVDEYIPIMFDNHPR